MKKEYWKMLAYDLVGSFFLGVSIVSFAMQANFAPGGVSGLAVLANYLFQIPVGWATILINIPIILLTFRQLGKEFFLISVKSVLISSLLIDYVCCYLPAYTGSRLTASILSGIMAGIGFSLFFNEGSSTGGPISSSWPSSRSIPSCLLACWPFSSTGRSSSSRSLCSRRSGRLFTARSIPWSPACLSTAPPGC